MKKDEVQHRSTEENAGLSGIYASQGHRSIPSVVIPHSSTLK